METVNSSTGRVHAAERLCTDINTQKVIMTETDVETPLQFHNGRIRFQTKNNVFI